MRTSRLVNLALFCSLLFAANAFAGDKMIINANAWTGNPQQPWAQTIVIRDSRIIAVGDNELAEKYPEAQPIDAKGQLVLPGFIDNHTHFMAGAAALVGIDTISAKSTDEFIQIISAYAKGISKGEWITGGVWDHEAWGGQLPQRSWIDSSTADNPVYILRTDGHMALVNSAAIELAGITRDTPDPEGGLIVRDENGEATGVLKDNAMWLVTDVIPPLTAGQNDKLFAAGTAEALKNGVTQIHNMSTWDNIAIFERAKEQGRLKFRVYYFPDISNRQKLAARIKAQGKGDEWLRFGGVKEFVDGSLGSTTAWFHESYTDQPETNGFPLMTMEVLKTGLQEAQDYGLQLAVHGIGDRANDELLDIFEEIGVQGHRARIEHAQHLSPEAIPRFAELGVIPSMQPYHAIDDGRWAEKRIGKERLQGTYAFKSLFDANAKVSFGSDWPVGPLNPIIGIYAAVTRRTLDGENPDGWVPEQKVSVEQAVTAYTINNAWAGFQGDDLGTIEAGKLADLVMLSDNIFEIDSQNIIDTEVVLTMIGGEVAYLSE